MGVDAAPVFLRYNMEHTSTTLSELKEGNLRMCLSAKRALKLCYKCERYPTCESKIVNNEYDRDMTTLRILQEAHNKKVEAIKNRWL